MSKRQRNAKEKRQRHAQPSAKRVRTATISGSLAATAAIGLASGAQTATAQSGFDPALVKDINPTGASAPQELEALGNTLFFAASGDPVSGTELWRSDGSDAGTTMLGEINPHTDPGTAPYVTGGYPTQLAAVGGGIFFSAFDGTEREPWHSDGTVAGTSELDVNPTAGSNPEDITDVGGIAYFTANDGTHGREVWRSDGTPGGTELVEDINATGGSSAGGLAEVGGKLFFGASDGPDDGTPGTTHGSELWMHDPATDATTLVADINATGNSNPDYLTEVGGDLFFSASDGTDNGTTHGEELWRHDPDAGTTELVENINSGGNGNPEQLTDVGGTLFFRANDGTSSTELWRSDGTPGGTELVEDINTAGDSYPDSLTAVGGTLFFRATDGTSGNELWRADTAAGTGADRVADINPAGSSSPRDLSEFDGFLFFSANDGPDDGTTHGRELWRSDGTTAGTVLVEDLNPTANGDPSEPTAAGSTLFFAADDGSAVGRELWKVVAIPEAAGPSSQQASPSNQFSATGTDLNSKKGIATLGFTLPGPGQLDAEQAAGAGASAAAKGKKGRKIKPTSVTVVQAGPASLTIRPTKAGRRILVRKGKLKVKVRVTFTPTGGSPNSQVLTVLLKLR